MSPFKKEKKVIVVIPARGGSKRFPGKNLYPLLGKPLIAHPIEAALGTEKVDRVIVSTDDEEIAAVAKNLGAEVPFLRPADLAADTSTVVTAMQHMVQTLEKEEDYHTDYLVLLQPTTPVVDSQQIDAAISVALENEANSVIAVSKVDTINHPYNIREIRENGTAGFWQDELHYNCVGEERPSFYHAANLWLSSYETLMEEGKLESSVNNYPIIVPSVNSLDIDYKEDLEKVEAIMSYLNRKDT